MFLQNLRVPCPGPSLQGSFPPVLYPLPRLRSNGCRFNLIIVVFGLQFRPDIATMLLVNEGGQIS